MENLKLMGQQIARMQWFDVLDILVVAALIYWVLQLVRSSGTSKIVKIVAVIVGVVVISALTDVLKLHTLNFIIDQFLDVGLIAIVILFQPELRRMIDHISNVRLSKIFGITKPEQDLVVAIEQVVNACEYMSREKTGALIAFARNNRLDEYFKTGTVLDAQVSDQLLRNVFFPKAALHDGAMIIRDGRVAAASCVLPLSESDRLSVELGTRHRAGVGLSEVSDAVVIIVSEETGSISVAVGGVLKRHLAPQTLDRLLRSELCTAENLKDDNMVVKLRQRLRIIEKGDGENEE